MRDAFMAIDVSKTGAIQEKDLRFYLRHWGVAASQEKFKELFDYFDADGDGQISYADFQSTVGKDMHPDQGRYWRRDNPRPTRIKSCKSDHCWHVAQDFAAYCQIHLRMMQSRAFALMRDMRRRLGGRRWDDFVAMLREKADPADPEQLFVDDFLGLLTRFEINLSH